MKQQISFQTASDKAPLNTFGNRPHSVKARAISAFVGASLLMMIFCQTVGRQTVKADTNIGNVPTGTYPAAVAVNPVTNKIYVANEASDNVTVIDGTNNSTATVTVGLSPTAVAVNPVTNKIYVAISISNNVTVIDGTNNSTQNVATGTGPRGIRAKITLFNR